MSDVTEDDLMDALREHYAASSHEKRDGEFSVIDYMTANGIPRSRRRETARLLDGDVEKGKLEKRRGGVQNGARCVYYKFKTAQDVV